MTINQIIDIIQEHRPKDEKLYLVGGYVRDYILGHQPNDIDLVTTGDVYRIADVLYKNINKEHNRYSNTFPELKNPCSTPVTFERFCTVQINIFGVDVEIVKARKESYNEDSRKPDVKEGTLEDDIYRRDFTINTLAIDMDNMDEIIDLTGCGLIDIKNKTIRTPLDPDKTFYDDPLRMLRAIRYQKKYGFCINYNVFESIKRNYNRLNIISKERIRDEFLKILDCNKYYVGIEELVNTKLMKYITPKLYDCINVQQRADYHDKDVYQHIIYSLKNCETDDILIKLALLFHDIGKPLVAKWNINLEGNQFKLHEDVSADIAKRNMEELKFSNDEIKKITTLVKQHMRIIHLENTKYKKSALRRIVKDVNPWIDELFIMTRADIRAMNPDIIKEKLAFVDKIEKEIKELDNFMEDKKKVKLPVTGYDVMEIFDIEPGIEVGNIMKKVEEQILEGYLLSDHKESAIEFLERLRDG